MGKLTIYTKFPSNLWLIPYFIFCKHFWGYFSLKHFAPLASHFSYILSFLIPFFTVFVFSFAYFLGTIITLKICLPFPRRETMWRTCLLWFTTEFNLMIVKFDRKRPLLQLNLISIINFSMLFFTCNLYRTIVLIRSRLSVSVLSIK